MPNRKPISLNELMIVNPSNHGEESMPYQRRGLGAHPNDGLGGVPRGWSGPAAGAYEPGLSGFAEHGAAGLCASCGDQQIGYYGDFPDHELIGHYCPSCDGGDGSAVDQSSYDLGYADALRDLGQAPSAPAGPIGAYGEFPDAFPDAHMDGPGPHVAGYVRDVPPPFNPRGDFGDQLSGYVRQETVNPTAELREEPTPSPPGDVPGFFRPHF